MILITILVTSNQNKIFYATLPIRISLVYADIAMFLFNFKNKNKNKNQEKKENQRLVSETLK